MKTGQRDIRLQGLIVENNKFLLVKHLAVKQSRSFWALPGGARENQETEHQALIREIKEETGLTVQLDSKRFLSAEVHPTSIYKKMITYLGYPVNGSLCLGEEPEFKNIYELVDVAWYSLDDFTKIDSLTAAYILPVRNYCLSDKFKITSRIAVMTPENQILLVRNEDQDFLSLPSPEKLKAVNLFQQNLTTWGWMLKIKDEMKWRIHYWFIKISPDVILNKIINHQGLFKLINIEDSSSYIIEDESRRFIEIFLGQI
ncbi:MAG: hypothetical protein APR63_01370 [Desulfuromonas sp. SDB]|nr:MAG: hypothetical protein APR63_01370 [Desulfuromonas sp. SDB]